MSNRRGQAKPTLAVDGSHNDRPMSVDGLNFDPYHRRPLKPCDEFWKCRDSRPGVDRIWLVVWNMAFIFPYIGNNHPN